MTWFQTLLTTASDVICKGLVRSLTKCVAMICRIPSCFALNPKSLCILQKCLVTARLNSEPQKYEIAGLFIALGPGTVKQN